MCHFVPCRTTTNTPDLANLFLHHVWKHQGLPQDLVSNRDPQFASDFWQQLCTRRGITSRLSTDFRPETDGQTERANQTMEQYLHAFASHQQDDWSDWLPMAEFAANNEQSETTQITPFFAHTGHPPQCSFDLSLPTRWPENIEDLETVTKLNEIHKLVRAEIRYAQERQQEVADESRVPAPTYQPGDKVWLNARNITTRRPSVKLDHKRLGPFLVTALVGKYTCRLELPTTMKIHNIFHACLLEPAASDPFPGQIIPPAPPVDVDGEEEWDVTDVLDSRMFRQQLQYLIKWTGYNNPTWEPAESVNGLHAINLFHQRYTNKPGPLPK